MGDSEKVKKALDNLYFKIAGQVQIGIWLWADIAECLNHEKKVQEFSEWIRAHTEGQTIRATRSEIVRAAVQIGRGGEPKVYEDSYREMAQEFLARINKEQPKSGEAAMALWLPEFDEDLLLEPERLDVILPLIKWCADHEMMTDFLKHDLKEYYQRCREGWLEKTLADRDLEPVRHDLIASYQKVFGADDAH